MCAQYLQKALRKLTGEKEWVPNQIISGRLEPQPTQVDACSVSVKVCFNKYVETFKMFHSVHLNPVLRLSKIIH